MYNETFYWKFITSLRCHVASWQIIWHCPQICKPPAPNGENKVFCLWWGWETTIERSQWQTHKQTLGNLLSFSLTVAWHLGFREWWLRIPDIFAASETHERDREGYDQKPKESMSICTINCADIHNLLLCCDCTPREKLIERCPNDNLLPLNPTWFLKYLLYGDNPIYQKVFFLMFLFISNKLIQIKRYFWQFS